MSFIYNQPAAVVHHTLVAVGDRLCLRSGRRLENNFVFGFNIKSLLILIIKITCKSGQYAAGVMDLQSD